MDLRRTGAAVLPMLLVACGAPPARDAAPPPPVPAVGSATATGGQQLVPGLSPAAGSAAPSASGGRPASPALPATPPTSRAHADGKPPMCPAQRPARCVDNDAALAWWGPALLSPRGGGATFVLFARDGAFGNGDGQRDLPREVWVVLAGRVGAYDGGLGEVLDAGGIVLVGTRTKAPFPQDASAPTVRVRGREARVAVARSDVPGRTYRVVTWTARDGAAFVSWRVMDDGDDRSLDELVRTLDALAES